MRSVKVFQALVRPATRQMTSHSGTPQKLPPVSPQFRAKQEFFQMDNGSLVHLRGGMFDRFLYFSTMGLIGLGLAGVVTSFYKMAFPRKPE